jgi:AcrR family transcriptional regulator
VSPYKTPPPGRRRRTAEEAREEILDAAEAVIVSVGPAGLRLQEVAAEVGVSHPTVLHHFGSREQLIGGVMTRALERMQSELLHRITRADGGEASAIDVLELTADAFDVRGYGRLIAWFVLSGYDTSSIQRRIATAADVIHEKRRARFEREGRQPPPREDTLFIVMLATLALFGESVAGDAYRQSAGLGHDPDAKSRFHKWLARLILDRDAK